MKKQAVKTAMKRKILILSGIICLIAAGLGIGARVKPHVYPPECVGCGDCVLVCPKKGEAISLVRGKAVIDLDVCIACYKCVEICSYGAVRR